MDEFLEPSREQLSPTDRLSERQKQCLELVAQGCTSKQIGRVLNLSPSTVDNHLSVALERLGVSNRDAAAEIFIYGSQLIGSDTTDKYVTARSRLSVPSQWRIETKDKVKRPDYLKTLFSLPTLGGRDHNLSQRRRFFHVIQIMFVAMMAFSAITITIAGMVHLFSR